MKAMIDLRVAANADAPGSARHVLDRLEGTVPEGVLDDVRLLVSELVTNSVRHAGLGSHGWVRMRITVSDQQVRVEVSDPGPGFDAEIPVPSIYQESGWGLFLVEQVARRWGVARGAETLVWFEIDLEPAQRSA
jgi:anti-sigma regulatory factor (Ser/Thr protein kinase)